jgi:hypothetical protein
MPKRTFKPALPKPAFVVYPFQQQQQYFVVHIARGLKALRRVLKQSVGRAHPQQLACCVSATSDELPELIGVLYFSRGHLGGGIVAHEMAHAAFRAIESEGKKVRHWRRPATSPASLEERYAHVVEHLVSQFYVEAYQRGYAK